MIDHFTVTVSDLAASRAFYEKVLGALGYETKMDFGVMFGMGDERKPYLWFKGGDVGTSPQHIAFVAKDRATVDAFHKAALEEGARDDGLPGLRADYHPNYYAAFVVDPLNGHPLEAVCHTAPGEMRTAGAAKKKLASKKNVAKKNVAKKNVAKKKKMRSR